MKRRLQILLIACVLALICDHVGAVIVVDNLGIEGAATSFGEAAPAYWAQSFIAESSNLARVTLLLSTASGPDDADFRVLITETSGGPGDGIVPTNVLFESSTRSVPFDPTFPVNNLEFTTVTVETDQDLIPGMTYAILLDAFVEYDGIDGSGAGATNDNYAGGHFFHYGAVLAGGRSEHFANAAGWVDSDTDLAFQLVFAEVPEPATLAMLAMLIVLPVFESVRFQPTKRSIT